MLIHNEQIDHETPTVILQGMTYFLSACEKNT